MNICLWVEVARDAKISLRVILRGKMHARGETRGESRGTRVTSGFSYWDLRLLEDNVNKKKDCGLI